MAVGQFFNPEEGEREFSPWSMTLSSYSYKVNIPMMLHYYGIWKLYKFKLSLNLND